MWAAVGMLAVTSVMTMVGASRQASAQRAAGQHQRQVAEYKAAVARNNAIIAQRKSVDARIRGDINAERSRQASRLLQGRQRAVLAANGVVVDDPAGNIGSLRAVVDTAGIGEVDALTVRSRAEREALGFELERNNALSQQQLLLSSGFFAEEQANFTGDSTMLAGVFSVAEKWGSFGVKQFGGGADDGIGGGAQIAPYQTHPQAMLMHEGF
jgi:hypothetical protein